MHIVAAEVINNEEWKYLINLRIFYIAETLSYKFNVNDLDAE